MRIELIADEKSKKNTRLIVDGEEISLKGIRHIQVTVSTLPDCEYISYECSKGDEDNG